MSQEDSACLIKISQYMCGDCSALTKEDAAVLARIIIRLGENSHPPIDLRPAVKSIVKEIMNENYS